MKYSLEIINKVLEIRDKENSSYGQISARLRIPKSTIAKWLSGHIPMGKRAPKSSNKVDKVRLKELLIQNPDMYLAELAEHFGVTAPAIHYHTTKLGFTYKKKDQMHPKSDENLIIEYEKELKALEKDFDVIFADESGFPVDLPRLYGRSPRGERCPGSRNWNEKGRQNVIGTICNNELVSSYVTEGNINSDIFHAFIEQILLKELKRPSVIIMDNASFHKRQDTINLIEEHGHKVLFLPPYSPQLNPIEKYWAKLKSMLRKKNIGIYLLLKKLSRVSFYV